VKHHYRPSEPALVPAAELNKFPKVAQVTVQDAFGGWKKAQAEHFADGGFFDRIYRPE
jgi:sulfate transport system substrate-binding protein